ncbi:MAG: 1-acyl-sn-glycerol-3-phosphate acyltransferase [Desulfobacterales bacterium]
MLPTPIGLAENQEFASIDPASTVVFVMNHRSNMDYILVAFLAAEKAALSYAVGEWAKIWPLQTLIRAMGAYFVRRQSGNPLYRKVLERYINMATKEGVCQAVFPEGGLSRDGRLRPPKLGIFDYMLRNYEHRRDRDIVFIPVGINYDRTLEDRSLLRALDPEAPRRSVWFAIRTTLRFIRRGVILMILSRWQRFGYACVNFGPQISMRKYCQEHKIEFSRLPRDVRFSEIEKLAGRLMSDIKRVIPVLPISLVATVMRETGDQGLSAFEVEAYVNQLIEKLHSDGVPVYVTTRSRVQTILDALNMLKLRHLVIESDGIYKVVPEQYDVLSYYANSIIHWIAES